MERSEKKILENIDILSQKFIGYTNRPRTMI